MKDQFNNAVGPQIRNGSNGHGNGSSTGRNNFSSKLIPALAVLTMGAGLQAATQFFARSFHYQAVLGPHFNFVYPPWAILIWAGKWFKLYPDAFMHAGSIGVIGTGFGLTGLLVARTVSSNSSTTNEYLHGSARWANEVDIRAAGLMPRSRTRRPMRSLSTAMRASSSAGIEAPAPRPRSAAQRLSSGCDSTLASAAFMRVRISGGTPLFAWKE